MVGKLSQQNLESLPGFTYGLLKPCTKVAMQKSSLDGGKKRAKNLSPHPSNHLDFG